jgi:hypothetical protein
LNQNIPDPEMPGRGDALLLQIDRLIIKVDMFNSLD